MRDFAAGELWGPFKCEIAGCPKKEAYTIRLTDEENSLLPEQSGDKAVTYIFNNKLGTAMCSACLNRVSV